MKQIIFAFNHLQYADGVARSAIGMANALAARQDVKVILRPLFKVNKTVSDLLHPRVTVKPLLGFYVSGLSKLLHFLPRTVLYQLIFGRQADVAIGFQYGIATRAVVGGRRLPGTKRYVWMHGYDEGLHMKADYLMADKVMCVSRHNAERLFAELKGKVPVYPCYNLVDDKEIYQQAEQPNDLMRPNTSLFVTVGRLSLEKGFDRLIQVFGRLRDEGHAFHFWLIGDGPEREKLEALINRLSLSEQVTLLGEQSNPHQFTSRADVFVCSSFAEGYNTACYEASILGIPLVSTDVSGAHEIVQDAQAGLVVPNDEVGLYQGLKQLLSRPELVVQWKKTLESTRKNFYYETRVAQLYRVLELED
ncbi:glycosyltransferase [Streptococcus sp. E24BD]|uniref:glycosyltransferase n=1 Tax=Streptococcus sp. E24BD TaxID=3278715 RepID=UPI00359CEA46